MNWFNLAKTIQLNLSEKKKKKFTASSSDFSEERREKEISGFIEMFMESYNIS